MDDEYKESLRKKVNKINLLKILNSINLIMEVFLNGFG